MDLPPRALQAPCEHCKGLVMLLHTPVQATGPLRAVPPGPHHCPRPRSLRGRPLGPWPADLVGTCSSSIPASLTLFRHRFPIKMLTETVWGSWVWPATARGDNATQPGPNTAPRRRPPLGSVEPAGRPPPAACPQHIWAKTTLLFQKGGSSVWPDVLMFDQVQDH